jgi:uncharacterized membrane protein YfcA
MEVTLLLGIAVAIIAFLCGYVDSSVGMGYGTTLAPLLLLFGFLPLQVIPAVLLGQLAGGFVGSFFHHKLGNVEYDFRPDEAIKRRLRGLGYLPKSPDAKIVFVLAVCGISGALVAVFFTLNIPTVALQTYIGIMIAGVGVIILIRRNRLASFSWKRLAGIGLISSFNKGASGGGYGPLVTAGQIMSGGQVKNSVGITSLAETIVCIVAFTSYALLNGNVDWTLASATATGSVIAAPFSALTVKKLNASMLQLIIGVVTIALGISILIRTYVF